jgi:hypothetical protein
MLDLQHVSVKIFARNPVDVDWKALIRVYHRWIQQNAFPEALHIDVADYSHVPSGPGVMLIGHNAAISLDNRQGRVGMLYNRKTVLEDSDGGKLRHSYEGAVAAARRLVEEPEFRGHIAFDESDFEITVNDRLISPNTQESWDRIRAAVAAVFDGECEWNGPGRELLRVRVRAGALAGSTAWD